MPQYFLLILVLIAIGAIFQIDFVYYLAYVCAGLYVINQWYTPRILRHLRIARRYNDHAYLGETVTVTVTLHNLSRLPAAWLQVVESTPYGLLAHRNLNTVVTLGGRSTLALPYTVAATRRGYYRLGPLYLMTGDVFGFLEQRAQSEPAYLTVYAQILPLAQIGLPSRLPFGTVASRQRLYEDPARPQGVRDYRSGDSLRQIHWKASGHTQTLMVKTLQPAISLQTVLALNLNLDEYARRERLHTTEWGIVVATSVAAALVHQRQPVGLLTNGIDPLLRQGETTFDEVSGRLQSNALNVGALMPGLIPPRPGRAQLMKVLEVLARIEAGRTAAFNNWLLPHTAPLSWGTTLILITPNGDEATCALAHRLVRAGLNTVLLVTQATGDFGRIRDRARRLGFNAFLVRNPADLAQTL